MVAENINQKRIDKLVYLCRDLMKHKYNPYKEDMYHLYQTITVSELDAAYDALDKYPVKYKKNEIPDSPQHMLILHSNYLPNEPDKVSWIEEKYCEKMAEQIQFGNFDQLNELGGNLYATMHNKTFPDEFIENIDKFKESKLKGNYDLETERNPSNFLLTLPALQAFEDYFGEKNNVNLATLFYQTRLIAEAKSNMLTKVSSDQQLKPVLQQLRNE